MKITFFPIYDDLLSNKELGGNARHVITLCKLIHRINLSITKGNEYYDENKKHYYAIFTQKDMRNYVHCSSHKMNNIYKDLDDWGYIDRKKIGNHKADKIFIGSHLHDIASKLVKNASRDLHQMQRSNSEGNEIDRNEHVDHSSNSINAEEDNTEKSNIKNLSNTKSNSNAKEHNPSSSDDSLAAFADKKSSQLNRRIIKWIKSVHNGLKLGTPVIKSALKIGNQSTKRAKHIIDLVKNAKTNVSKEYNLSQYDSRTRFEYNVNLSFPLAAKLIYAFNYANRKAKDNIEKDKYITKCMKNFFVDAFGIKKALLRKKIVRPQMYDTPIQDGNDNIYLSDVGYDFASELNNTNKAPRIPIFDITKS